MNLDRRLIRQLAGLKWALGLAIGAGFLGGLAAILQARQVSRVIAAVFLAQQRLPQVMPWMWLLLGAILARAVLAYLGEIWAGVVASRIKAHLQNLLARHMIALGPAYGQGERSGELVATATQGIEALDAYFSQYLPQLALAGVLPLAYLLVILPQDPLSGLVLLLTGPLIPVFMFLIGSTAETLTRRRWTALGRMSAYLLDTLQGLTTLKALGRSREQAGRMATIGEQYRQATMGVLRVTFLSALVLELLSTIGTAIVAVEIGLRLLYGRLGFESAFFILLLAPEFYQPLRALGLRFHASMSGVSAARRIFEVLEQPLPAQPPVGGLPVSLSDRFVIDFDDVHYTYPGRTEEALRGVTLHIESGQMVALVGPSGAGKSTLAGLLLRFFHPSRGLLCVNGRPLAEIPLAGWRSQLAWVSQRPHLFHGTITENLRIALPSASLVDLRRAAGQAFLLDWIESLPLGWETPLGDRGARLSGGQAQRLALARAFLRGAPLLILDEPTAHLDVEQEQLLEESVRRLYAGRTVLVIAHRLPTAARADRIAVLSEGRIVEDGSHAELAGQAGVYARLWSAYQEGAE